MEIGRNSVGLYTWGRCVCEGVAKYANTKGDIERRRERGRDREGETEREGRGRKRGHIAFERPSKTSAEEVPAGLALVKSGVVRGESGGTPWSLNEMRSEASNCAVFFGKTKRKKK